MSFRGTKRGRPEQTHGPGLRITPGRAAAVASLILVVVVAAVIIGRAGSARHAATPGSTVTTSHPRGGASTARSTVAPGTASVPILVYHVINTQPAGSSASPALYVPADEFAGQMRALEANGWHAVTLDQLEAYWTRGARLGRGKPIVITFDNGYASHYTNALPVLRKLGWKAVEDLQLSGLPSSEGGLTEAQIKGLVAAGWELDTQGLSHTNLTTVGAAQLTSETATARQMLRSRYGVPANWFSYPAGDYDAAVVAAVRAAGYTGATTVNPGWASPRSDRFRLPRLVVAGATTPSQLLAQIAAARAANAVPASYIGAGTA